MLVLSRKKSEAIVIDGQIKIEVLKIKGNTIRLGITAPAEIKVFRGELARFGKREAVDGSGKAQQIVIEQELDSVSDGAQIQIAVA